MKLTKLPLCDKIPVRFNIEISTKELFDTLVTNMSDIIWDTEMNSGFEKILVGLARRDKEVILKAFQDGHVPLMVPSFDHVMENFREGIDEIQVDIYNHHGHWLMMLGTEDVNW